MKRFKQGFAKWLFNYILNDPESGLKEVIQGRVDQMTILNIMKWMDDKRILHCIFCHRQDELTKHPMGMMCKMHKEMHERQPQPKLEVA